MSRSIRTILNPAWLQGRRARPPYFEGWYFKLVDADQAHRYAVIPGIFLGRDPGSSHAFVQVLDGTTGQATYHQFPLESFWAAEGTFDVHVGPNRFTLEHISLHVESPRRPVIGELHFADLTPWPVTFAAPGIMGWYAWMPSMQCYHGVLSLDHAIGGTLVVDGRPLDFAGGRGYIEKDWGRSFPTAWVWMQTNHFTHPGTSLTASVAVIPWLGSAFRGFIAGLWHEGTLYRFATYTGARIERLAIGEERVDWVMRDRNHRLEISAHQAHATVLRGPSGSDMGGRVPESLQASADVRLSRLKSNGTYTIFEDTGHSAGLEIAGEIERLLSERRSTR